MGYPKFISLTFLFVLSSHLSTVILSTVQNFSFLYLILFLSVSTQLMIHFLSYRNCLNKNLTTMLLWLVDVTSLFTNIPLDETIKIIADQLFSNSNNFEGFSRDEFVKLLNLAVKNCHLIFNGKFYDQIDGVAMGSPPLGPLLAHIFLSFHETNWLKDCPFEFKPLYYQHYIDDSFIFLNHVTIFYHFLITLILSIRISLSHIRLKKINVFLFLM